MKSKLFPIGIVLLVILLCALAYKYHIRHVPIENTPTAYTTPEEALTQQAIAKYLSTLNNVNSKELIEMKIREAVKIIEAKGSPAFNDFRGNSRFISGGTYLWVAELLSKNTLKIVVHPVHPEQETQLIVIDQTSALLRHFWTEALKVIQKSRHRHGWVVYDWPDPKTNQVQSKATFVKLANFQNKRYVVCGGTSDPHIIDEIKSTHP